MRGLQIVRQRWQGRVFGTSTEVSAGRRSAWNTRLQREHSALRAALARSGALVALTIDYAERNERLRIAPHRARGALVRLSRRFPAHFAREEAVGYLAEALEVAPRYHVQAEVLREQHAEFALEISRIAELARTAGRAAESWQLIRRDLAAFAELLRAHEDAESEIMEIAFLQDIGSGG